MSRPAAPEQTGVRIAGLLLGIVTAVVVGILLAALGGGIVLLVWQAGVVTWEQMTLLVDVLSALGLAGGAGVGTLVLLRRSGLSPVAAATVGAVAAAFPGFQGVFEQLAGDPKVTWRQPLLLLAGAALGAAVTVRLRRSD